MECRHHWLAAACCSAGLTLAAGCNADPSLGEYRTFEQLQNAASRELRPTPDPQLPELAAEEPALPASALGPVNVVDGGSVSSVLSVVDRPLAVAPAADALDPQNAGANRVVQVLIPEKDFRTEGKKGELRVSYDDLDLLKVLNMEPVTADAAELMPAWLKALNGKPIRIRGFMYPTFEPSGIEQFVLARDNQICCFGRDPKVYDLIAIQMKSGKTTNYIPNRPFDVAGVFRIEMYEADGKPLGLYWISDAEISLK